MDRGKFYLWVYPYDKNDKKVRGAPEKGAPRCVSDKNLDYLFWFRLS